MTIDAQLLIGLGMGFCAGVLVTVSVLLLLWSQAARNASCYREGGEEEH